MRKLFILSLLATALVSCKKEIDGENIAYFPEFMVLDNNDTDLLDPAYENAIPHDDILLWTEVDGKKRNITTDVIRRPSSEDVSQRHVITPISDVFDLLIYPGHFDYFLSLDNGATVDTVTWIISGPPVATEMMLLNGQEWANEERSTIYILRK